jgi:hypothetical protein
MVASMTQRTAAPPVCDETESLVAWLDYERATLALKCDGLDSFAAAVCSVAPSNLSLIGLVRHLTDVELRWFVDRFCGTDVDLVYRTDDNPDAAFTDVAGADLADAIDRWSDACAISRQIVASTPSLDQLSVRTRRTGDHFDLRWLLQHLIGEYARHNGHADLIREAVDGSVGT